MPECCGCASLKALANQVAPKGVTYELIRVVIWLWAYSSPGCCKPSGPDRALHGSLRHPSDHSFLRIPHPRCFLPPGIPAEMVQRSLIRVLQTWVSGVWLPPLLKLLLLLWLWMLETSESKSPAAHHATEKARCAVFSHTDATSPFWKCAKS